MITTTEAISRVPEILKPTHEISYETILANLLDGKVNLDLKSEINQPKELASLYILAKYLKNSRFPKSAKLIYHFIKVYLRYMVSYKRQSRKEIIQAISYFNQDKEITTLEKLTSNLK